MGLRIIDRHRVPPVVPDVSEAEILAALMVEARQWSAVHGPGHLDIQAKFIDNFRRVRAASRPVGPEALAARIGEQIRRQPDEGATPHAPLDIATLLELL